MAYPSTLSSITNPNAGDKLNSPSHSSIHTQENTAISEIQTFVGTLASTAGTLMYDIRSSNSDGGGHVQGVNKGGTGFTTYTKGDVLVAQSQSVLSKLGVGLDGQVLTANSSVATGVNWATNPAIFSNKISVGASISGIQSPTVAETSLLAVTVAGSILGTNNAIRTILYVNEFRYTTETLTTSVVVNANFGNQGIASIRFGGASMPNTSMRGRIEYTLLGAGTSSQRGQLIASLGDHMELANVTSVYILYAQSSGTSSVDTGAAQTLGLTAKFTSSAIGNTFVTGGYVVEKIA